MPPACSLTTTKRMLASAVALTSVISLQVELQAWTRNCFEKSPTTPLECTIPAALGPALTLQTPVEIAAAPGETRVSKLAFGDTNFSGEIRFYSAYPSPQSGLPPYIQIQIESMTPLRSLCLQSVRLRAPFEASPLSCTGLDSSRTRQVGFNVKLFETPAP